MDFSTKSRCDSIGGAAPQFKSNIHENNFEEPAWYAFQTRHRFEKKTDELLRRKGLETFLPILRQLHRWSDRRKLVEVPLFDGYGFVRLKFSQEARLQVLRTPGVIALVGSQTPAGSVPAMQIETLRHLLSTDTPVALTPFFCAGKRVRIRSGALSGVEGILQDINGKYLIISIDVLRRSVAIKIENYSVELI